MKNRISFLLGLSLLLIASSAHAAPLTWVSGVGDPLSPVCSRTWPCKTFAQAIPLTDVGGEISVLDPGDFGDGLALVITKSITINGGSIAGITAPASNGVVVNVTAPGDPGVVILRGLSINGGGTGLDGIRYLAGARLVIENCRIYGFAQSGIDVSLTGAKNLLVKNSALTNDVAAILLASTTGSDTFAQVTNSVIAGNTGFGVHADGKGTVSVANSLLANNGVAIQAETLATVRLSNNEIFDNTTVIGCGGGTGGGTIASWKNNRIVGGVVLACASFAHITER